MRRLVLALSAIAAVVSVACVTASSDARVVETLPDRASFPAVSDLLDHRCGTLDCHGVTYRNLRIYGREGLRSAPGDRPSSKPGTTTTAEYDATFASVIALEPEIMSQVLADRGASPERLTLVRKARGAEAHKGLAIWGEGSPEDRCLTSWLTGSADTATCVAALAAP
ncbi:MAG TPA: hypothetical protein VLT33_37655 [Labilithrix sp.]|nr:hypothetical protein [Labilithrix sp.]